MELKLSFRRTLVGLKLGLDVCSRYFDLQFQTYPRGVEVAATSGTATTTSRFRRTLVGLKWRGDPRRGGVGARFRRTLVGLKFDLRRRTRFGRRVSDVPSWG